ncbi:hypothetical protein A4G18_01330 [Pasteurellaceae bacterium Pebbles2]|nr:hypothetical protein [Pasteurellaceae bacterium Pebbles2]
MKQFNSMIIPVISLFISMYLMMLFSLKKDVPIPEVANFLMIYLGNFGVLSIIAFFSTNLAKAMQKLFLLASLALITVLINILLKCLIPQPFELPMVSLGSILATISVALYKKYTL